MGSWLEKGVRRAEDERLGAQREEQRKTADADRQRKLTEQQALEAKYAEQRRVRQELSERVDQLIASLPIDEVIKLILEMYPDAIVSPFKDYPTIGQPEISDLSRVRGIAILKSPPWKSHEGGGYSSPSGPDSWGNEGSGESYFPKYKYKTKEEVLATISLGGRAFMEGPNDVVVGLQKDSHRLRLDDSRFVLMDIIELPTASRYSICNEYNHSLYDISKRDLNDWRNRVGAVDHFSGFAVSSVEDPVEEFRERVIQAVDEVRKL